MRHVAILTAAGSGSRLGSDRPKALVELAGVPLVVHAARALVSAGAFDRLVVTSPVAAQEELRSVLADADLGVEVDVVVGGASRQASVSAGLAALGTWAQDTVVLVHDAARPLVPADVVRRVLAAVEQGHTAVVPGVPLRDTVKQVDERSRVVATPDRRSLRAVQTPQGFRLDVLRRAHAEGAGRSADEATAATDDAALVEALGLDVHVVDGDHAALKVTDRRDLALAELLLAGAL